MDPIATIERGTRKGRPCIRVSGELDPSNVGLFDAALRAVMDDTSIGIEVDLLGVTYFGSEAIGALVKADLLASDLGLGMIVIPSHNVRRVLEITGLDTVLHVQREL
jgi:anti-anti-sigma factor